MERTAINIEEIMEEIRQEARELKYTEPVSFEDVAVPVQTGRTGGAEAFDADNLQEAVSQANNLWHIPYGHVIEGNAVKRIVARAARKANRATGAAMANDITMYNAEVIKSRYGIMLYIGEAQRKAEEQERRIFELEAEVKRLKAGREKKA